MTKTKTPPETEASDIRDRLHEILDARHINAASLAAGVGMNQQQLYDCFAHRRRLEATEFLRICRELTLTLDDFKQCL